MSDRVGRSIVAVNTWLWLGPAVSLGLYAGRLSSEWLQPGLFGAALLTLLTVAGSIVALRHRALSATWPLLLLLAYVFYPEPDPRIAAGAGLAAVFGLLLSADTTRISKRLDSPAAETIIAGLLSIGFFVLYVNTLAPGLLPADAGELQLVAANLGVAHPTGFPLYTMLANLATRLPIGPDEAYRVNLLSALVSTGTLLLLFLAIRRLCSSRLAGLLAATALGTSATFWSQATTANVRSLTAFFTAAAIYLLLLLRERQNDLGRQIERRRETGSGDVRADESRGRSEVWLEALFVLVLVLAASHHLSLIFLGALFGLYTIAMRPATIRRPGRWPVYLLAAAIALLPLLYLPLRGAAGAFGAAEDLATVRGFMKHVLGLGFRGDLFFVDDVSVLWARLRVMANVLTFQFSPLVLIVMILGLILLFRRDRLLAGVLAASLVIHTLVAAVYRAPQTVEYMLPVYVLLAFLYGYAGGIFRHVPAPSRQVESRHKLKGAAAVLVLVAMTMAVLVQAAGNYRSFLWLSQDTSAREYAQPLLEDAPAGALILADWHWATPLWYLQEVEGLRPDVHVQFVFPESGPYARTWANRITTNLAAGRTVIATHYDPGAYTALPLAEPFQEAFLFRQAPLTVLPEKYIPLAEEIGPEVQAVGYHLDTLTVEPGQEIVVSLAWRPLAETDQDRTLFAHLIGPDGMLDAGDDQPALAQPEGLTISQFRLTPRLDAAPDDYAVVIGSYDNGQPAADFATVLGQVQIEMATEPPFTSNRAHRPLSGDVNNRTLIGHDWDSTLPGRQRLYLHWSTAAGYETQSIDVDGGQYQMPPWNGPWGIEEEGSTFGLDRPAAYVPFGQGLVWLGQDVSGLDPVSSGQRLASPQWFTTSRPIMRDLVVSLRLVGYQEDGQSWDWWDLDDGVPALGAIPTLKWLSGSRVRAPVWSFVSSDARDGQEVEPLLVLYDAFTSRQLPVLDERYAQLAPWIPLGRNTLETQP
ncbi:MAG: DUF2723 domain-containing protein [Chloroflexota bacterium]|nr:MAG: DUF2723 domain-containing protein [Chloroflexota bacterium]